VHLHRFFKGGLFMAENFNLIFGQNASQQYAWNDADYQNGWETIGNIPPTAAQFDALQRRADTKSQELNSRLTAVEQSIVGGGGQKRETDTAYSVGDVVTYDGLPMDWVLVCIVGGTTGSADITLPSPRVEGARILDGTVTWAMRKIATYGGIGYRQSSTSYYTGAIAYSTTLPAGWYLECTTAGTTSASDLVITSPTDGDTVTDGTVVWMIYKIGKGSKSGGGTPTGTIIAYASNGALPDGYLACDGSAVSRTTYADLFAAIGTTWGAGDGSTTFNLPNLTDKFVQGSGTVGTVKSAGLPNITGSVGEIECHKINMSKSGALSYTTPSGGYTGQSGNIAHTTIGFNAKSSNSIYGNSTTVQPPAVTMRYMIKY
jgi:microcystin-dependent protein